MTKLVCRHGCYPWLAPGGTYEVVWECPGLSVVVIDDLGKQLLWQRKRFFGEHHG